MAMRRDCNHIPCRLPDCDCKIDYEGLEFVDEVEIPELGNLDEPRIKEIQEMAAKGEKKDIAYYALPKDRLSARILESVLNTLAGRNRVGKVIGRVKDVLSFFVPYGGKIDRLTDTLKNLLFKPNQNKAMATKKKTQSKTWWGILTVILSSLLGAYGIAADPSFLSDGFQLADDLEVAIAFIGTIAGWGLERWGQRTATQEVK